MAVDRHAGQLLGTVVSPRPGGHISELGRDGELDFRLLTVAPAARWRGIGRLLVEHVIALADEDALRERLLSLADRLYPVHPAGSRLLELAGLLLPHARSIYDRWYQVPIDAPASVYNARRSTAPPG